MAVAELEIFYWPYPSSTRWYRTRLFGPDMARISRGFINSRVPVYIRPCKREFEAEAVVLYRKMGEAGIPCVLLDYGKDPPNGPTGRR